MKLFAIYVGGEAPGANIEVHDVRFVAAESIFDTYDELRRQWWGSPASLHIDCWAQIEHADGHDVTLRAQPNEGSEKLFYVNLGGYDRLDFTEQHKNVFVVANSIAGAKARALASVKHWHAPHKDDLYEAEQAFCLNQYALDKQLHIHLEKTAEERPFRFTCDYTPLRAPSKSVAGAKAG